MANNNLNIFEYFMLVTAFCAVAELKKKAFSRDRFSILPLTFVNFEFA